MRNFLVLFLVFAFQNIILNCEITWKLVNVVILKQRYWEVFEKLGANSG